MSRRPVLAALLGLALAAPVPALAASRPDPIPRSRLLWATVNVCDTKRYPNTVGVRASIPGDGRHHVRMWLRFRVQYHSSRDHRWHDVPRGADSGWIEVGTSRYRAREAGERFRFLAPRGKPQRLRGQVTFEWRRGTKVLRHLVRTTSGHHPSAAGADPRDFTAATCLIR